MSAERTQQLLAHVASCEKCGVTLRLAAEAIHGEDALEEALPLPPSSERALLAQTIDGAAPRSLRISAGVDALPATAPGAATLGERAEQAMNRVRRLYR